MTFSPKKVLVPVDVDPMADRMLAERLVDDACAFAKVHGASLVLLHVAVPLMTPMAAPLDVVSSSYRAMLDVAEARNATCGRTLGALEERARGAGVQATSLMTTRPGSVPAVIAEIAGEEADMVMMTTHARRGLRRAVLGSVAERTAHLCRVPVLLLPPLSTVSSEGERHASP